MVAGVLFGLTSAPLVTAQTYQFRTVLSDAVQSLCISNTVQFTNALSWGTAGTNVNGLSFTNNYGDYKVANNGTNSRTRLVQDVPLDGFWSTNPGDTNWLNVVTRISTQSGANSTVTFTFVPIYGDGDQGVESTLAGDAWTWSVLPSASSTLVNSTNLPLRFQTAQKIRLKTAVNTDTDNSSRVNIHELGVSGYFRP